MIGAAGWAVGITAVELVARRLIVSRAVAWLAAYGLLLVVAVAAGGGLAHHNGSAVEAIAGLVLVAGGYQSGRALLKDRPNEAPKDSVWLDLVSVGVLVPVVEEMTWGARVEPQLGIYVTALLFATKHVVIDHRWRRFIGLALFWIGLGLVRSDWTWIALIAHVTANMTGVAIGHHTEKDQF